jgi:hypothetical protein
MKPLYIERHNTAARTMLKAIRKGAHGAWHTVCDIGKQEKMKNIVHQYQNRIPSWILPNESPDMRGKCRPDILIVEGLKEGTSPNRNEFHRYKMIIVEVGYTSDTRWQEKVLEKQSQHAELIAALERQGWHVDSHIILLGVAGCVYTKHTVAPLHKLGMTHNNSLKKLLMKLHRLSIQWLDYIVTHRYSLTNSTRPGHTAQTTRPQRKPPND